MTRKPPTDDDILSCLYKVPRGSPDATYVIKNRLRGRGFEIDTAAVLRQLKRLEKAGKVVRVPTGYVIMLSWRMA